MVSFKDIQFARDRISRYIYKTPLDFSMYLSNRYTDVFLKLECQQRLKGFKIRGALSKMTGLTDEEKARGVLAVSSGNHGAGVSYAAKLLGGIGAKIFVPVSIPESKLEKIKYYGAEVVAVGSNYDEAHAAALEALDKEKRIFIDPCSDIEVIAGQGSIAMEILEANPDIDVILAPIGGGGLITGVSVAAKHIKPSIRVIGIQTSACPAMVKALEDRVCYMDFPSQPSICDALVGGVGEIPYKMAGQCIDDIVLVEEESVKEAVLFLMDKEKVIAEPAGAVGVAAVMAEPELFKNKNVAIIISGGNLDFSLIKSIQR
ncbi:threonine ammonia-lyase [Lutispora saccharofermentans]|uniref:Pyridoxal-phosphate dependent enzyme n=1 Tax=Lutispora saccharofermentans TaxID=3024236 RepID=A0ABT1NEI6_9FIRM|nr:threonine/serine dehydratase [Lutispora saccharofermentans]MCQ1529655.1 pyridoxal-phosphate dependent enzyme [Lutispora saccharofermentans]